MNKDLREFKRDVEGDGRKLISLTRSGKSHYKALIADAAGRTMTYTLACSSSDERAAKNRRADIKRFFNN